jgi:hypothetical protein
MTGQMVDNPRRAWLQSLLNSLGTTLDTMRPVLDTPACDVGSGKVWSGTRAATQFETELSGRSRRVHTLTDGLRTTVENALRAEPLKVTEAQARQMQFEHQHVR